MKILTSHQSKLLEFYTQKGLRYIIVVKTAARCYPMKPLSLLPLNSRGHWKFMISTVMENDYNILAALCVDRERRYCASLASSTNPGQDMYSKRWGLIRNTSRKNITETAIPILPRLTTLCITCRS